MIDPYIGQIGLVAFNFAPPGWALCNGQMLSIQQNQHLFEVIGNVYGGDGVTQFALPDLRSRAAVHSGTDNPLGSTGGAESVTLDKSELAQHTHTPRGFSTPGVDTKPANNLWAASNLNDLQYAKAEAADALMADGAVDLAGGGQAHDNMPPVTVLNFVIALQGIFPRRG
jgi:microcystin-dependent protein